MLLGSEGKILREVEYYLNNCSIKESIDFIEDLKKVINNYE